MEEVPHYHANRPIHPRHRILLLLHCCSRPGRDGKGPLPVPWIAHSCLLRFRFAHFLPMALHRLLQKDIWSQCLFTPPQGKGTVTSASKHGSNQLGTMHPAPIPALYSSAPPSPPPLPPPPPLLYCFLPKKELLDHHTPLTMYMIKRELQTVSVPLSLSLSLSLSLPPLSLFGTLRGHISQDRLY